MPVSDYRDDPELLALLRCWREDRRCPFSLQDWLLDRGLDTAAACAEWANRRVTGGIRFCCPADFYESSWGWFRNHPMFNDCVPNTVFEQMYPNKTEGESASNHHHTFEDAVIHLLDNWIVGAESTLTGAGV